MFRSKFNNFLRKKIEFHFFGQAFEYRYMKHDSL